MPENISLFKELQKELSTQCSPISYTRVNTVENCKTLSEFWNEIMKFAAENGMTIEDNNDARHLANEQRIKFDGVSAIIAQYDRFGTESEIPLEHGYNRTSGPERIWFHLDGARYNFSETSPWSMPLTLYNSKHYKVSSKTVHTCEYETLKNVLGVAVIELPFSQQKVISGCRGDGSTLFAYLDMASTTYRNHLMGILLPLVKESLLTIQKFVFICKKIVREREILEAGKDYVS